MKTNRRSSFVIHRYQIQFSVFITLVVMILTVVYSLTINLFLKRLLELIPPGSESFTKVLATRDALWIYLVGYQVFIGLLIFALCIRHTLSTAGPIARVCRTLERLSEGLPAEPINLRRGDNFKELAATVNELIKSYRRVDGTIKTHADAIIERIHELEKADLSDDRRKKLLLETGSMIKELKTFLAP